MTNKEELIKQITDNLASQGKLIEGGWRAMEIMTLEGVSPIQKAEMRKAFFAGAQHLFASIMTLLDPGSEPTEKDLERMSLIHKELEAYTASLQ